MASVLRMLEEREAASRVRVEGLRKEVARLAEVLEAAEIELDRRVIARDERVEALAVSAAESTAVTATEAGEEAAPSLAPVPGSTVPPWREGLPVTVLAPDHLRIVGVLEQQRSTGHGPLRAKEIAVELGLGATPAKVEGLRSKARRLAERGWLFLEASGGHSVPVGRPWPFQTPAHPRDHRPPDQRLAGGGQGLVVPGQAAGVHQPGERALCQAPPRQHHEPLHVVGSLDDLQG
ncbi:hypothetical protein [Streptomyces roseochromogenus]|uniref:hypothetical protein n=1 Tax=Streptomyces roseochromogenus TaxID=285450 RepID=UPI001FD7A37F|nr:hypothetical protein [Streptomyces roseochromogenus]